MYKRFTTKITLCNVLLKKVLVFLSVLFYRLDLDKWINAPPSDSSDDEPVRSSIFTFGSEDHRLDLQHC